MTKRTVLLAVLLFACGDRVSLGEHGSGRDPLSVSDPKESSARTSTPPPPSDDTADELAVGEDPITWSDIEYIEVDESVPDTPRKIRVDADCHVTDHDGLDAMGDATRCQELLEIAVDTTDYGCGYSCVPATSCNGTVRVHLKDGRDLVRDLAAERCSVQLPSVPTDKFVYAVWYSAGGG